MQPADLSRYKGTLSARKAQLAQIVGNRLHGHGLERLDEADLPQRADGTDGDAIASQQRDTDVAQLAGATRELAQIEAALARIADGRYGVCIDCGEAIPPARLDANPAATRCTRCQQEIERHDRSIPHAGS
jgi:DnaK suppressor protein